MSLIAIIDVETTGLNPFRHDRVIEIAVLLMRPDGMLVRQFVSLVNPERDIGPTSVHGLVTRDLIGAPRFTEIAGDVIQALDGSVAIAGHNVRFDHSFLSAELLRIGFTLPEVPTLCTMRLAGGGNLIRACSDYGVAFDGMAHSALDDALVTSRLLATLLDDAPRLTAEVRRWEPISWPAVPTAGAMPLTRDESRRRQSRTPSYLQRLLNRMQSDVSGDCDEAAVSAYTGLLDRVLEDRHIDENEGEALVLMAREWGISSSQIRLVHNDYFRRLAETAAADGIVTQAEQKDLQQVATLLGVDSAQMSAVVQTALQSRGRCRESSSSSMGRITGERLEGKRVCFTGECQCRMNGKPITREVASESATGRGMVVEERVTKKLDVLVVADPLSQSGKAKKAREYGIRILHEPLFWNMLGIKVD